MFSCVCCAKNTSGFYCYESEDVWPCVHVFSIIHTWTLGTPLQTERSFDQPKATWKEKWWIIDTVAQEKHTTPLVEAHHGLSEEKDFPISLIQALSLTLSLT